VSANDNCYDYDIRTGRGQTLSSRGKTRRAAACIRAAATIGGQGCLIPQTAAGRGDERVAHRR